MCIEKLKDLQLASVIVRLYDPEKSSSAYADFLRKHVIGDGRKGGHTQADPFLRSMAYWHLGSYEDALKTLLADGEDSGKNGRDEQINITDIYNFYNFLRTHPLIMRQKRLDQMQSRESK